MKPLAYRLRPTEFNEVVGQDHLVGKNGILTKMLETGKYLSFILYGNPGTGKTTIAIIFSEKSQLDTYFFNASTDNKAKLMDICNTTAYHNVLLIIDEIHRMKADVQDYLLPFIESGKVTIIGLTALNPYQNINPAIRSRCHLYQVKDLADEDIKKVIERGKKELDIRFSIADEALDLIVRFSNHEVRSALNLLEATSLVLQDGDHLTPNIVRMVMGMPNLDLDAGEDNFYELLSALQKSIRGSDVHASLHYLGKLIVLGDLESIARRLMVIAYEDVGLANPNLAPKVVTACEVAKKVGLPEARIPLSAVVIEMSLSPKSNTAITAIDLALDDIKTIDTGVIPPHADNKAIRKNPNIYHYPHDSVNSLNEQTYLPSKIKNKKYYHPKDESPYEKALKTRYLEIEKIKKLDK
ncbi:MAG: AAA family ATPase [Acholeplasmataceae bacterium]|jgi:putative ATPase